MVNKMKTEKIAKYYCTGCGLCMKNHRNDFQLSEGFYTPKFTIEGMKFCEAICPCFDDLKEIYKDNNVWGSYKRAWLGHSTDDDLRYQASSGGCISAIAIYLLDNKYVDGIIHSVKNPEVPWQTITVCSTSSAEVKSRCGSRYAQSTPLLDFEELIEANKKYAYIGKPCDVYSLKKYQELNDKVKNQIVLTISFFCAGQPSENANVKLVTKLLGKDIHECKDLNYRGFGWPGKATAIGKNGESGELNYQSSWGQILGRDIRNICKYCMIGTGEVADISCGDAWYLTDQNEPCFNEGEGRNIVFGRTEKGMKIINEVAEAAYIKLEDFSDNIDQLKYMQPSHYDKKITMISKFWGMNLFRKPLPKYNYKVLHQLAKNSNYKRLYEVFRGTIGRIVRRRL